MKRISTTARESKRLDQFLTEWLPETLGRPISKSKIRKLIMAGAVYVNGRSVRIPSKVLMPGAKIEARIDVERLLEDATSRDKKFELTADRILFEDEDLIAIDKPPGLPSHPTADPARDSLFAAVRRSRPYLGVHQRLDRDTSGVVLFTKTQRVNKALADLFARHQVVKTYQALTLPPENELPQQWTIKNHLEKKLAETSFRVIAEYPHGVWVEAIPRTGRKHQIRVHLAEYGLPIFGDDVYGEPGNASRLMLHAARLELRHPISGNEIRIESPLPADFEQCLRQISLKEPKAGRVRR